MHPRAGDRRVPVDVTAAQEHVHRLRRFFPLASIAAVALVAACASSAPPASAPAAAPSSAAPTKSDQPAGALLKAPGEATVGDRTTCPTSGEEFTVTPTSPKVEYQGKTYYFCCGGCDAKFAREPEKYLNRKPGT